jgi:TonB family protein
LPAPRPGEAETFPFLTGLSYDGGGDAPIRKRRAKRRVPRGFMGVCMKAFVLAVAVMAAPAWADAPAANGDLTETTCAYPGLAAHAQGATLMTYSGSAKGVVEDVKVLSSSGNSDLDAAAVACVSRWRFDPRTALGARLIGAGRLNIAWKAGVGRRTGIPHTCQQDYPQTAIAAQASGVTRLRFVITVEGRVRDLAVETSSGHADLDTASLECARFWRYRPATKDGQPVEVPWKADIKWELYNPPVPDL